MSLRLGPRFVLRLLLSCVGCLALTVALQTVQISPSFAETPEGEEAKAFEAAKALGTVEAWGAFLTHYPNGFRADLARAYVKKLSEQPSANSTAQPPPSAAAPSDGYPLVAGTWGGIVRSGPGQGNARVASLDEGETVTLMAPPITLGGDDFPWFKIAFRNGEMGFMWGGILCSRDYERPGLFKICTSNATSPNVDVPPSRPQVGGDRPSWCASPSNGAEAAICRSPELVSLDRVMNVAYRRAKSDSPGEIGNIDTEQRKWLGRRNLCGDDASCVRKRYNEQIKLLEGFFGN